MSKLTEGTDRRRTAPATRSDLLEATMRLLAGGTSVAGLRPDQIAAEAGMSRATFYLHFRDKSELIAALAEDHVAWREDIGADVLANPALERATLDAIIQTIVARWADNHNALAAIVEVAEYDPAMAAIWRTSMGEIIETAADQFRRRWPDGRPGQPDPDMTAALLTWMFERSCHQILGDPDRQDEVVAGITEIIWRVLDYRT